MALSDKEIIEYTQLFNEYDSNGDGSLSPDEIIVMVRKLGYSEAQFPDSEVADMFIAIDTDKNNRISLQEYLKVFAKRARSDIDEANLRKMFHEIDKDKSGKITKAELKASMKKSGMNKTDAQIEAMIQAADHSGDGQVDIEEFLTLFK